MLAMSSRSPLVGGLIKIALLAAAYLLLAPAPTSAASPPTRASRFRLEEIPFDGRHAYEYLKALSAIGPRPSGSAGMAVQQRMVADHFRRLGAVVSFQEFRARSPLDGSSVPMANMIVQWHPDRPERILLGTHYDTRPYPDRDKRNPQGVVIGADDAASGLAVLMELGQWMPRLESKYGVDFVIFDGSQFVFKVGSWRKEGDPRFLGAEFFARSYVSNPPPYKYRWGVLLDRVGNEDLQVYEEYNSMSWRNTRPLVEDIWRDAYKLGVREFIPDRKQSVSDDHLRLSELGNIPTCAIVDPDDPYCAPSRTFPPIARRWLWPKWAGCCSTGCRKRNEAVANRARLAKPDDRLPPAISALPTGAARH